MLKRLVLALSLALVVPGCAALAQVLPTVIATVTEAITWLEAIDSVAEEYFNSNPDPATKKAYKKLYARAQTALSAAMRASRAAEKLGQEDIDAAFEEFRKAYQDIVVLLGSLGVVSVGYGSSTLEAAPGDPMLVPPPEDLIPKVRV